MNPLVRRTWAVSGETPILKTRTRSWKNLSGIGGLTLSPGRHRVGLLLDLYRETIKQPQAIEFLRHLLQHLRGHILLLWDRLSVHRGKKVASFVEKHPRLHVEFLPPYAPELNPIEYAWSWMKMGPMANKPIFDLDDLNNQVQKTRDQIITKQVRLKGFINAAKIPIRFNL